MTRTVNLFKSATSPTESHMTAALTLDENGVSRSLTVDGKAVEVNRQFYDGQAPEEFFAEVVANYKSNGWVEVSR